MLKEKITSLPFQLIGVIIFVFLFGHLLSDNIVRFFYTFSCFFKEILSLFLPFMVFAFITSGILSFKKRAPIVLSILLLFIVASNFCASIISFLTGRHFLPYIVKGVNSGSLISSKTITPLFNCSFPQFIGPDKVILASVLVGIIFSIFSFPIVDKTVKGLKSIVETVLNRYFIPFLPIYVLGFLLKMYHEGNVLNLFGSYGKAFVLILLLQAFYLFIIYFIGAGCNFKRTIKAIRIAMPSYLTAFSSMSSTATIPITIKSATRNTGDEKLPQMAVPILANVHLAGDSVTVPIFSLVTIFVFMGTSPDFYTFLNFVLYFCLTMLAVSGVPGGGIIVMIPILKSILGFNPAMISIITALYLLQDSFGTACNVMGDGALTIIVNKVLKKFRII